MQNIRDKFPIFKNNPELIYFDSAASSQKPDVVIDAINKFYTQYNSNVHRGLYPISEKATDAYEKARETVAAFVGAEKEEIIFTSGATEGINLVAHSLERSGFLDQEPVIVLSDQEHHSNILPWQDIAGAKLQYLEMMSGPEGADDVSLSGVEDHPRLPENVKINTQNIYSKADVIALTHMSNVTGAITDVPKLTEKYDHPYFVLDASQSVAHMPIDVGKLGIDFLVFSGHKLYGPMGIGVLYIRKEILKELEPFKKGGGMIDEVKREASTWKTGPEKFEAGTPNVVGAIGLASAVEFINTIGFEEIMKHEEELRQYALTKLTEIEDIQIFHGGKDYKKMTDNSPSSVKEGLPAGRQGLGGVATGPVLSFTHNKIHPHDIAQFLGEKGICVRAGHHCTQILHRDVWNVPATVRLSLGMYNTKEEVDRFVEELKTTITTFS